MIKYKSLIQAVFSSHLITQKPDVSVQYGVKIMSLHILQSWETYIRLFAAGSWL